MAGNDVCDFCSGKMPVYTVVCDPIDVRIGGTIVKNSEDWAACKNCVKLIKAKDLDGLVDRVAEAQGTQNMPPLKAIYKNTYRLMFDSMKSIKEDGLETLL